MVILVVIAVVVAIVFVAVVSVTGIVFFDANCYSTKCSKPSTVTRSPFNCTLAEARSSLNDSGGLSVIYPAKFGI